jgi:hypothetical protein
VILHGECCIGDDFSAEHTRYKRRGQGHVKLCIEEYQEDYGADTTPRYFLSLQLHDVKRYPESDEGKHVIHTIAMLQCRAVQKYERADQDAQPIIDNASNHSTPHQTQNSLSSKLGSLRE